MKTALIIGASRGLGFAIVQELLKREWNVVATSRKGRPSALDLLAQKFLKTCEVQFVDITQNEEISQLKSVLSGRSFDLLFVNAGVANAKGMSETIGEVSTEEFTRVMNTNSLSVMRAVEQLAELVIPGGTIGVMSSGQASISDNETGGNDTYRASKAALNMLMRSFAARANKNLSLLLLAPGWIQTDMGGSGAKFTIDEVIHDIVNTITSQEKKGGLQYLDRFGKSVRW